MIQVSKEFKEAMKTRTDFTESAEISFADGRKLLLSQSDFTMSNNGITDGAGSSSFPLGVAVEKSIQIELMNDDDHLSEYDFQGAVIRLKLHFALENRTETIDYGTYTVVTPEAYGSVVTIDAVDDMYRADVPYTSSLNFPVELGEAVRDACATLGIALATPTFKNDDFVVQAKPEDITFREFFAMASMIACGYARIDYEGKMHMKSYDFSYFEQSDGLNGGIFDPANPYKTGDKADGGSFNPWNVGYEADAGSFKGMDKIHVLYNFTSLTVETDDVVITGIKHEGEDGETYFYGKEGYVLSIENSLISGQEQKAVDLIGESIVGIRFRPFSSEHIGYPLAEFGDLAYIIDRKNNAYQTVLTDIDFTFFGLTLFTCAADSPVRNSSSYASNLTKAVVQARKNTAKQISDYDREVQRFASMAANSMGLYETKEEQPDGSIIYYQHDKPTLAESQTIWKNTAGAFLVSNDGGETWRGMDAAGNALLTVLSVVGIKADWIIAGLLKSQNGNTSFDLDSGFLSSQNGDNLLDMWAASLSIKNKDKMRIRFYNALTDSGLYQCFSGNVDDTGTLIDDTARYSFLTSKSVGVGQKKDGSHEGIVYAKDGQFNGYIYSKRVLIQTENSEIIVGVSEEGEPVILIDNLPVIIKKSTGLEIFTDTVSFNKVRPNDNTNTLDTDWKRGSELTADDWVLVGH